MGTGIFVNAFSNDPHARDAALEPVEIPDGENRFAILGWTGAGGLHEPGTPEFQAGSLYVALNRVHQMWTEFFGDLLDWHLGVPQLPVNPRAGKSLNAYYDRKGLKFFYGDDSATGKTIYTCESADISAHECGHAILDARHPDYWDALLAETSAFHEAFGDISALLLALGHPGVRRAIFAETAGDLTKSNVATRLAEQLARGFDAAGQSQSIAAPDALRDFVNPFQYQDPDTLPARAPAAQLSSESHNFARVFTGAFYDFLIALYQQIRHDENALEDDALAQARNIAGRILGEGLDLAPKGDAPFKTVAVSMFKSSAMLFGDARYFQPLRAAWVGRGIVSAAEADAFAWSDGRGNTQTSTGGGMVHKDMPRKLGTAEVRIGKELPPDVGAALGLSRQAFQLVSQLEKSSGNKVLDFRQERQLELVDHALGIARGVVVNLVDAVSVMLDASGELVASHAQIADTAYEKRIQDHIAKLIERNRIFIADDPQSIDSDELIDRRQPYYIAPDEEGNRRIYRAFVACGAHRPSGSS